MEETKISIRERSKRLIKKILKFCKEHQLNFEIESKEIKTKKSGRPVKVVSEDHVRLYAEDHTHQETARYFGISRPLVVAIVRGKRELKKE